MTEFMWVTETGRIVKKCRAKHMQAVRTFNYNNAQKPDTKYT